MLRKNWMNSKKKICRPDCEKTNQALVNKSASGRSLFPLPYLSLVFMWQTFSLVALALWLKIRHVMELKNTDNVWATTWTVHGRKIDV